jgi:hypothetical protein
MRKHQEKNRGHRRSGPYILNLQTIKQELQSKIQVKQYEGGG